MIPKGLVNLDAARRRWGNRVDEYAHFFYSGDPLADALVDELDELGPDGKAKLDAALTRGIAAVRRPPPALAALFREAERVPDWVDFRRCDLGARTFQRTGLYANVVLSCVALMTAYRSSVANKPLVFTGQLERMAQRRLAETGRYVLSVCQVGGLRPRADGYQQSLRVRLVHARVRRMLARSGRWNYDEWGAPVNQANMAGTTLLFSAQLLAGLRKCGFRISREEGDALMHLWRYAGFLNGVNEQLLFDNERDARELWELGNFVQPGADDTGRALARALSAVPEQHARNPVERAVGRFMVRYMDGMTRALNGDAFADDLGVGHTSWKRALEPTRWIVSRVERARETLPGGTFLLTRVGNRAMLHGVSAQLRGREPAFEAPRRIVQRVQRLAAA